MKLKRVILEDFVNYKEPSMFLITCYCDWKCCTEANISLDNCQNNSIISQPNIDYSPKVLYDAYKNDDISKAIVFGGLEPMLQIDEIIETIDYIRKNDAISPIIIYTGYYSNEIQNELNQLKNYNNIIVKFGRFIPNQQKHYDEVLGTYLASDNQYAQQIS